MQIVKDLDKLIELSAEFGAATPDMKLTVAFEVEVLRQQIIEYMRLHGDYPSL